MSKYKKFNYPMAFLILFCIVLRIVLMLACGALGFVYFHDIHRTTLYKDTSDTGHKISVYESGRAWMLNIHSITVKTDGKDTVRFTVRGDGEDSIFSRSDIICEDKGNDGYRIAFCFKGSVDSEICFNSDFSKITYANVFNFECLNEDIELGEIINNFYDPF